METPLEEHPCQKMREQKSCSICEAETTEAFSSDELVQHALPILDYVIEQRDREKNNRASNQHQGLPEVPGDDASADGAGRKDLGLHQQELRARRVEKEANSAE